MQASFDDKWFKAQKRKAGVTNADLGAKRGRDHTVISKLASGAQPMTLEWGKIFSEVFELPLAVVLEKTGFTDIQTAQAVAPGFAEGDVVPFAPAPAGGSGSRLKDIADLMTGQRPGVDVWQVSTMSMSLGGYLPGDYICVDTHQSERVKPGDVVIAQVYTPRGATTVLRRFEAPVLVSASTDPADARVYVVDGVNVLVRGKVISCWRTN